MRSGLILPFIFIVLAFFPYVKVFPVNTDLQPNFMAVGLALIALNPKMVLNANKNVLVYGLFAIILAFIPYDPYYYDFSGVIRGVGSSMAFVIGVVVWDGIGIETIKKIVTERFVLNALTIYALAGLVQIFIDPDFFTPILSRQFGYAGSDGRGVESLTAEPTYLAIQIFLILRLCLQANANKMHWFIYCLALGIVAFISKSATVISTLIVSLICCCIPVVYYIFVGKNVVKLVSILIISILVFVMVGSFLSSMQMDYRLLNIVNNLLTNGIGNFAVQDWSVRDRLFHIEASILLAVKNCLIPNGYGSFEGLLNDYNSVLGSDARNDYGVFNARIMSGYGGSLFEFGVIGLIPIILITKNIYRETNLVLRTFWMAFLSLLLIQSVQISNPLVAFLASSRCFTTSNDKNITNGSVKVRRSWQNGDGI
jgi:hypothetical protein